MWHRYHATDLNHDLFCFQVLPNQMELLKLSVKPTIVARFKQIYQRLWVQNGDNISRLYAGTKALDGKSKVSD